jgi:hypothetical protein
MKPEIKEEWLNGLSRNGLQHWKEVFQSLSDYCHFRDLYYWEQELGFTKGCANEYLEDTENIIQLLKNDEIIK